ncbi:MAG: YcxB family protein [Acidimicrobiia bacterium]
MAPAVARFALTADEYAEGLRTIMRRQPTFWVGPLLGAVTLALGLAKDDTVARVWGFVVLALAGSSFWLVPALRWRKSPGMAEEQEHTFTEGGIHVRAGKERGQLPWGFYTKVVETPHVYVLLRNSRQGNFVPKRGFPSPDAETSFRALAAANLRANFSAR